MGENRMTAPAISDERRIPVPVAESQLKVKMAASAAFCGATGGTRKTTLCRPGTVILKMEIPLRKSFVPCKPQIKTSTLRRIQGTHASITFEGEWVSAAGGSAPS